MRRRGLVVDMNGDHRQDLFKERSLCSGPAGVAVQFDAGQVLRYDNSGDCEVVGVEKLIGLEASSDSGDENAGIENQSCQGSPSRSADTVRPADSTCAAKTSSRAGLLLQRRNTSPSALPLLAGAGMTSATRRPARVTAIVSPRSAESSTEEKFREASEADNSYTPSDYQIPII